MNIVLRSIKEQHGNHSDLVAPFVSRAASSSASSSSRSSSSASGCCMHALLGSWGGRVAKGLFKG